MRALGGIGARGEFQWPIHSLHNGLDICRVCLIPITSPLLGSLKASVRSVLISVSDAREVVPLAALVRSPWQIGESESLATPNEEGTIRRVDGALHWTRIPCFSRFKTLPFRVAVVLFSSYSGLLVLVGITATSGRCN